MLRFAFSKGSVGDKEELRCNYFLSDNFTAPEVSVSLRFPRTFETSVDDSNTISSEHDVFSKKIAAIIDGRNSADSQEAWQLNSMSMSFESAAGVSVECKFPVAGLGLDDINALAEETFLFFDYMAGKIGMENSVVPNFEGQKTKALENNL